MAQALPESDYSDFSDEELSPEDKAFNKASNHVRKITSKLNDNQLLELYGLYKQASEGKCNIPKPGFFNIQGRQKWEAWKAVGELPHDKAKVQYVALVQKYDPDWNELTDSSKETWVTMSSLRYSPEPELVENELSIIDAAREDFADRVTKLLLKHPELKHEKDEDGLTALHWAADRDAAQSLKAAIAGGCLVDATDDCGQTALHYAASCGHIESTQILLEAGASPLLKDKEDATPLDLATDCEVKKILQTAVNKLTD